MLSVSLKNIWTDPISKTQVYLINIEDMTCAELSEAYFHMSPERRKLCDGMRFEDDKKRCITADMTARAVISEKLGVSPESVVFIKDELGKPQLKNEALHFNLSHAGKYVALAINESRAVGIDIEKIRPVKTGMLLKVCTQKEIEYIFGKYVIPGESLEDLGVLTRFFEIWTYKEAYLKCSGVGIRKDMKEAVFDPKGCYGSCLDGYYLSVVTNNL